MSSPEHNQSAADISQNAFEKPNAKRSIDNGSTTGIMIDPAAEKKLLSRFDVFVLPQFFIIVMLGYLDRTNIGNARIFGFEKDLGMSGNDFANVSSIFYVTYVIFEVPWVLAIHKFGANVVLACAIISWSAVVIGTGFIHDYKQALALRLLLGITEAGMLPATTFIISTIYPRNSQGKRIAVLYGATAIAGAFGGLIAYAIQTMGDRHGLQAWRWLFVIEGIISIVVGMVCWASLPATPDTAWFLKSHEKKLIKDIQAREVAYRGTEKFACSHALMAVQDPLLWVASITFFCSGIPLFGFGTFLPTIIRGLGYESLEVNYLTIPVYMTACLILGIGTWTSDKLQKRAAVAIVIPVVVCTGYAIAIGSTAPAAGYAAMFLCSGVYTFNTLVVAWVSNNIIPENKRSVAIPILFSIANVSGIAAGQVYPPATGPRYLMGNGVSFAMEFASGIGIVLIYLMLRRRNAAKAKQIAEGITDNGKKDDKGLDFEYIL